MLSSFVSSSKSSDRLSEAGFSNPPGKGVHTLDSRNFQPQLFAALLYETGLPANAIGINISAAAGMCRVSSYATRSLVDSAAGDDYSSSMFRLDEKGSRLQCEEKGYPPAPHSIPKIDALNLNPTLSALRQRGYVRISSWGLDMEATRSK